MAPLLYRRLVPVRALSVATYVVKDIIRRIVFPCYSSLKLHVHSRLGLLGARSNLVLRYQQPKGLPRQHNLNYPYGYDYSLRFNTTGVEFAAIHS